jgi:hypothetical protein
MKLSSNFHIEEFEASETAARLGLDNSIPASLVPNATRAAMLLEQVRIVLGGLPITVTSGYRSPVVNKAVGGAAGSQHLKALAADFICPKFGSPKKIAEAIMAANLNYDQLILEFGRWVHISVAEEGKQPRKQELTYLKAKQPPVEGIV